MVEDMRVGPDHGHSAGLTIASVFAVGTCALVALAPPAARADDQVSSWTDTSSLHYSGPGTYNSAIATVFTASQDNTVVDFHSIRHNSVTASFNHNAGLVLFNQDSGNNNNQANIQSFVLGNLADVSVVDLATLGAHLSTNNTTITVGGTRSNTISGSFRHTSGVVTVNQTSGNLNAQVNLFQFGLGIAKGPGAIALDDTTLAAVTSKNTGSDDKTTSKRDAITGNSFDKFTGVAQVTQSSGDQNAILNATTVSVTVRTIK